MKTSHRILIGATLCMALGFAGCASTGSSNFPYKNYTVADGSAVAGEGRTVLFQGNPWFSREPASKLETPSGK